MGGEGHVGSKKGGVKSLKELIGFNSQTDLISSCPATC